MGDVFEELGSNGAPNAKSPENNRIFFDVVLCNHVMIECF